MQHGVRSVWVFASWVAIIAFAVIGIRWVLGGQDSAIDASCDLIHPVEFGIDLDLLRLAAERRALNQERELLEVTDPDSQRIDQIDESLARLDSDEEALKERRAGRLERVESQYDSLSDAEKESCQKNNAFLMVSGPIRAEVSSVDHPSAFTSERSLSGDGLMPHCSLGESFISVNTIQSPTKERIAVVGIVHNPSVARGRVTLQGFLSSENFLGEGYESIDDKWDFEVSTAVIGSGDDRLAYSVYAGGGTVLDIAARAHNINKAEGETGKIEEITGVSVVLLCFEAADQLHQQPAPTSDTPPPEDDPGEDPGAGTSTGGSPVPSNTGEMSFTVDGLDLVFDDITICSGGGAADVQDLNLVAHGGNRSYALDGSNGTGFTLELEDGSGYTIAKGEATVTLDIDTASFTITGPASFHPNMGNTLVGEPVGDATLNGSC